MTFPYYTSPGFFPGGPIPSTPTDPGGTSGVRSSVSNLDASSAGQTPASLLAAGASLLATLPVNTNRIGFMVQQQSVNTVWVVLDDGASGVPTTFVLDSAAADNRQGGSIDMTSCPHAGRIRVYGYVGSPVAVVEW